MGIIIGEFIDKYHDTMMVFKLSATAGSAVYSEKALWLLPIIW
jgi:hypothetical protein